MPPSIAKLPVATSTSDLTPIFLLVNRFKFQVTTRFFLARLNLQVFQQNLRFCYWKTCQFFFFQKIGVLKNEICQQIED